MAGACGEWVVVVVLLASGKAEDDVGEKQRTHLADPKTDGRREQTKRQGAAPGPACEAFEGSSSWTNALATNREGSS